MRSLYLLGVLLLCGCAIRDEPVIVDISDSRVVIEYREGSLLFPNSADEGDVVMKAMEGCGHFGKEMAFVSSVCGEVEEESGVCVVRRFLFVCR